MRTRLLTGLLLTGLMPIGAAALGDAQVGKSAAGACAACHGRDGISMAPDAPNLAGQPADYLAAQLRAYRDGERAHEQMTLIAQSIEDGEIEDLAAYFAAIEISATIPDALQ